MKLALVIVVGIGLYSCAVSAGGGKEPAGGEKEADVYGDFFQNEDLPFKRDLQGFLIYREHKNSHENDGQGSEASLERFSYLFKNRDNDGQGSEAFLERQYGEIFDMSRKHLTRISDHRKLSQWDNLNFADQEFKKNCNSKFGKVYDRDSGIDQKRACDAVDKQMLYLLIHLMSSGIDKAARDKLVGLQFLDFIKLWFRLDWDKNFLKEAIKDMKTKHSFLKTDEAAKVMVVLGMFPDPAIGKKPSANQNPK